MNEHSSTHLFVEIHALEDGAYRVVARVTLENGVISVDGEPDMVADLNGGIEHPATGETITPADGYRFLASVAERYQSPYLLATPVAEIPYGD